jgi:hypothetical protein
MSFAVVCPHCAAKVTAPEQAAGRRAKCPKCHQPFILPRQEEVYTAIEALADEPSAPEPGDHAAANHATPTSVPRLTKTGALIECPHCKQQVHLMAGQFNTHVLCPACGNGIMAVVTPPGKIPVECQVCRYRMEVAELVAGKTICCTNCGATVSVPVEPILVVRVAKPESATSFMSSSLPRQLPASPSAGLEEDGEPGNRPGIGMHQKHSGLGIASFLIAVLVGGLDLILAVAIATNVARAARDRGDFAGGFDRSLETNLLAGGAAMFCLNCMSVPLCLVGVGLAVVALIAHKEHNHLFTWMGLFGSGVVILGVLGFYLYGAIAQSSPTSGRFGLFHQHAPTRWPRPPR